MSPSPIRSRIQLVIVLAVIGFVTALVIPAIQKVREAAALVQSAQNLKQINLGLQNYESANVYTPKLTDYGKNALTGNGITSPFFEFMPYIEAFPFVYAPGSTNPERYHGQKSRVFEFKDKFGKPSSRHGGVVNTIWRVLLDPTASRELFDIPMTLPDGSTGYYATGSYAVNGMLPWGRGTVRQLGSNTIVFAERPQVCKTSTGESIYNLWGVGFYSPHMPAFAALAPLESPESWTTGQVYPAWPLPAEANAE